MIYTEETVIFWYIKGLWLSCSYD